MQPIPGETELERLVARSRLIGADPTLVVHGGGNTSTKTREVDHLGRERDVLRIKGSGTDLRMIGPDGFPGLYLDELRPLRERAAMSDEAMVAYLAHCMVEPNARRPSIETLLHAFLPARHVDHVHADAICALTNTADGERHVRAALGPDVAVVPYLRPGFALSRQVAAFADAQAVVLAKHGLVTWGETHEEAYARTQSIVAAAEAYLAARERPRPPSLVPDLDAATTESLLLALRGLLSRDGRRVLRVDRGQRRFADRPDVDQVATAARATPDHMLRIGPWTLVVSDQASATDAIARFAERYEAYFARHRHQLPDGLSMLSSMPKVMLIPGLGCVAAGADAAAARVNADIAQRSHLVTGRVLDAFGRVDWLDEADIFAFDYWPLELAKLQSAPPPRALSGHVAIVTGAGSPLGQAIAARLVKDGAHLILVGGKDAAQRQIVDAAPPGSAVVTDGDPVAAAIATFGGVDILVALDATPPQMLDRLAGAIQRQGLGGTVVALENPNGIATLPSNEPESDVRINRVCLSDETEPSSVAEAIAFLASPRSAGVDRTIIPVGTS
jgi:rhamnose utilization protein RhaD (predicted bifunctional aldolase and dehydrogenase)